MDEFEKWLEEERKDHERIIELNKKEGKRSDGAQTLAWGGLYAYDQVLDKYRSMTCKMERDGGPDFDIIRKCSNCGDRYQGYIPKYCGECGRRVE